MFGLFNTFWLLHWMMWLHFKSNYINVHSQVESSFSNNTQEKFLHKTDCMNLHLSLSSSYLIRKITPKVAISRSLYHTTLELSCPSTTYTFGFLTHSTSEQDCLSKRSYRGTWIEWGCYGSTNPIGLGVFIRGGGQDTDTEWGQSHRKKMTICQPRRRPG